MSDHGHSHEHDNHAGHDNGHGSATRDSFEVRVLR